MSTTTKARPGTRDRLGKMPRRTRVTVCLDDDAADVQAAASKALADRKAELGRSAVRRVAAARQDARDAGGDDAAVRVAEDRVHAADEAELTELRATLEQAERDLEPHLLTFVFRSLGRKAWQAMQRDHPPGREDKAEWKAQGLPGAPAYDTLAIMSPLFVASCVEPGLDADEVDEMLNGEAWNDVELGLLFQTAVEAQTQSRVVTQRKG